MSENDLAMIETELAVKLPAGFRKFMLAHGEELKKAAKTLEMEVVLEAKPRAIIKINKMLRKYGIEVGDDATPAPWPLEYLALSDNGAGDHLCLKLDEKSGAIYEFNGEEGRFIPCFTSLDVYRADLDKRLEKYRKSPKGKSDQKLIRRVPAMVLNHNSLDISFPKLTPPVTPQMIAKEGIDTQRLQSEFARLLSGITGIAPQKWTFKIGRGESPISVRVIGHAKSKSTRPFQEVRFLIFQGALDLVVQSQPPTRELDESAIDWDTFDSGLTGIIETLLKTGAQLTRGQVSVSKPTVYGYITFKCQYGMNTRA